jgi:hypothetical protein
MGLSYRPSRKNKLAGRNPMPESTISLSRELWIWLSDLQQLIVDVCFCIRYPLTALWKITVVKIKFLCLWHQKVAYFGLNFVYLRHVSETKIYQYNFSVINLTSLGLQAFIEKKLGILTKCLLCGLNSGGKNFS